MPTAPRGMRATAYGEAMIRHARVALASLNQAHDEVQALKAGRFGQVSVGAITTPGIMLLPQVISRVKQAHPTLRVSLQIETSDVLMERMAQSKMDILVARLFVPTGFMLSASATGLGIALCPGYAPLPEPVRAPPAAHDHAAMGHGAHGMHGGWHAGDDPQQSGHAGGGPAKCPYVLVGSAAGCPPIQLAGELPLHAEFESVSRAELLGGRVESALELVRIVRQRWQWQFEHLDSALAEYEMLKDEGERGKDEGGKLENKDEGGRQKDEGESKTSTLHPSSFIPHPSSFIPHPSSFIPHPSSFIPHPSSFFHTLRHCFKTAHHD